MFCTFSTLYIMSCICVIVGWVSSLNTLDNKMILPKTGNKRCYQHLPQEITQAKTLYTSLCIPGSIVVIIQLAV